MTSNQIVKMLIEKIELPEQAYDMASERYKNLGEYLTREESAILKFKPRISPQGSFRLGTAIRPLGNEEYDVDLNCVLNEGLSERNITQKELKDHVGNELEKYRQARGIKDELKEKRRCWRLNYADEMSFHLDIVPGIPAAQGKQEHLEKSMATHTELPLGLKDVLSKHALYITDNEDPDFEKISDNWHVSNPEGYAKWFEYRMRLSRFFLERQAALLNKSVDEIPQHRLKTPLQQTIQLLKRHRDVMYSQRRYCSDYKPISIIITTLAARAYDGENNIGEAILAILEGMQGKINDKEPRIPNPVNPEEDFADKWKADKKLEENFRIWLIHAKRDLHALLDIAQQEHWKQIAQTGFAITLEKKDLATPLMSGAAATSAITTISPDSPKIWRG